MIIEHPETLRTWLTNTLSPICDADPAALAKYVMALLKKDKSEQELKDFCVEQLDVFLQKETKGFVDQLFIVIHDKSYVNVASSKQDAVSAGGGGPAQQNVSSSTDNSGVKDIISDERSTVSGGGNAGGSGGGALPISSSGRRKSRDNQKPVSKRAASRSPTKSSHSRSRSKDRNRGGEKPATSGHKHGTVSSNSSSTIRDRDKENRELRYSRQHSPRDRKRHLSRDSGEKSSEKDKKRKRQRCRDYDEKGYCMRGDSCIYDHGPDPVVVEEVSLPRMITMKAPPPPVDFSQPPPGYSIHPPPPGVDHGFPAVTEAYNPEAPSISSSVVPVSVQGLPYGQPTPAVWGQPPMPVYPPVSATGAYNPIVSKAGFRTRELITLAEGDPARLSATFEHRTDRMGAPLPVSVVGPIGMSGGGQVSSRIQQGQQPQMTSQSYDKTNRTLEVRRIPSHLNTISKLNEHFSQFGQIINIQVRYQGDAEAALVTFANRHQAVSAYKSTAPILNNRFIRMFWHNKDSPFGGEGGTGERGSVRDRLGPAPVDPMTPIDDSSMKARRVDTIEDADGNFRDVQKKKMTFQKAKMDLYNKHVEYQKKLLGQLEKCKDQKQRKEIAKTMKTLDDEIKKLHGELGEINSQAGSSAAAVISKPSKEQIERQLLDAELEMINQRQSGADTTDLHKRLMDLRREVMALNEIHIGGANSTSTPVQKISGAGSGAVGTVVAAVPANNHLQMSKSPQKKVGRPIPSFANLDKRPRELLVTGFQANERDALIEHFQQFGVLEDLEYLHQNKDQPQQHRALVVFKLRKDAEMAMQNGKEFNNHTVDIQWFNRRSHIPSDKEDSKAELTAQDLLATLDDEDDVSSDDNQLGEIDEDIPEIERGWKR